MSQFTNPANRAPGQADAYRRAIVDMVGDRDPLEIQARTPAELRAAVAGLTDEEIRRPEAPVKWSVAGVIQHLADSEVVYGWRLRLVLGQDRPAITGFDQDSWAARLGYDAPDVDLALRLITVNREANLQLVRTARDRGEWNRVGLHAERGEESVETMAKLLAGHDLVHLNQIRRIRAGMGR